MKRLDSPEIDRWRVPGPFGEMGDHTMGAFMIPPIPQALVVHVKGEQHVVPVGRSLRIIASTGMSWDHISVSCEDRCPNWDEMEFVRRLFARSDETWMQLGVPAQDHISHHPYCLHWWRPLKRNIPRPPAVLVGAPNKANEKYIEALRSRKG